MNELSKKGLLHTDCITVTGKTVGENIKNCVNLMQEFPVLFPGQEVAALFFRDGHAQAFHDGQHVFPDLAFFPRAV